MTKGRIFLGCILLAAIAAPPVSRADDTPATQPAIISVTGLGNQNKVRHLWTQLHSDDPAQVAEAVTAVRAVALKKNKPQPQVLQFLVDAGHADEAIAACVDGIIQNPANMKAVYEFATMRAELLLAHGDPMDALAAAKGCYNVCPADKCDQAIELVIKCLAVAHGDDPALMERFKEEQILGAEPDTTTRPSDPPTVLSGINVDGAVFQAAIDAEKNQTFDALVGKGNLLLLCDRTSEARQAFEAARAKATLKQWAAAIENIARAVRAQNGCIGPANAYVMNVVNGN